MNLLLADHAGRWFGVILTASHSQGLEFCSDSCPGTAKQPEDKQDTVFGAVDLRSKPKKDRVQSLEASIGELAGKSSAWAKARVKHLTLLKLKTVSE